MDRERRKDLIVGVGIGLGFSGLVVLVLWNASGSPYQTPHQVNAMPTKTEWLV